MIMLCGQKKKLIKIKGIGILLEREKCVGLSNAYGRGKPIEKVTFE